MEEELFIDVSEVLGLKEDEQRVSDAIYDKLVKLSDAWVKDRNDGILLVLGNFYSGIIQNMDFISGDNLVREDDKIWIYDNESERQIKKLSTEPNDGAILIHLNGKIIAGGVNLIMDNKQKIKTARENIPDNGGMRHMAGVYTSMRDDILAVFIMSGETGKVSVWEHGEKVKSYDPLKDKEREVK